MIFKKCRDILLKESELVQKIAVLQTMIQNAVVAREWTDFETHFRTMNDMGVEFAALEREREALFAGQSPDLGDDKGRFYALVSELPAEQRNELTAIYRSLKLESLKLRMANETLMSYISEARATITGFLEIAFPDRNGRIYTPQGRPLSHDMRSMVLNQRM
ncbi:MAG: hypothetical protein LBH97_06080 [Treponema sp.]|jgi:hypothetical protein|nr:hypothetical protein [Treponema sp.]